MSSSNELQRRDHTAGVTAPIKRKAEVGIYKRKQELDHESDKENKKKKERKHALDQESVQGKKGKTFFFLVGFLVQYLFSFINSHLRIPVSVRE